MGSAVESRPVAGEPDDEEETQWALLLDDIEQGLIIPVVGRDLLVVQTTDDAGVTSEQRYYGLIARELATRLNVAPGLVDFDGPNPLGAVASEYIVRGGDPLKIYRPVHRSLETVDKQRIPGSPAALLHLAKIDDFRVFVTTTFDPLLEECLRATRGAHPTVMEYAPGAITQLTALQVGEDRSKTLKILKERADSVVVHILGRASDAPNYVVTEEDAFEFVYRLQDAQPKDFLDLLSQMKLLIIGCRFPNWLVRFFLRTARRERLRGTKDDRTDYLVDADAAGDASLVEFLKKFRTRTEIFTRYAPAEFVEQLHNRWVARRPERRAAQEWMTRCAIFISYASEDAAAATAVANELRKFDLPVWFDRKELAPGDAWERKIRSNIKGAAAFVPILSRASAAADGEREFRKEWRVAYEVVKGMAETEPFIYPIALDKLPRNERRIDEQLRAIQWSEMAADGTLPEELVTKLRQARRMCQLRGIRG